MKTSFKTDAVLGVTTGIDAKALPAAALLNALIAAEQVLPAEAVADLRTDHAGETGAVCMYHGVLFFARDPALRDFAQRHMATEQAHLQVIESWLPPESRSRLLPMWRLAGWLTGAIPSMFGPQAVYGTIETVEQFVDQHYQEQIDQLAGNAALHRLRQSLEECRCDEVAHRDEAIAARGAGAQGALQQGWNWLVATGSRGAVAVCRCI